MRWLTPGALRRVKLAAVYLSMTLLCLIFAVLLVRSLLALVTWVALGRCLWLFPYLLSEVLPRPCPIYTWAGQAQHLLRRFHSHGTSQACICGCPE